MFSTYRSNQNSSAQCLFTSACERKYLNADERRRFLDAAQFQGDQTRLFCEFLLHSGCRISEGLGLKDENVLVSEGVVLIRSLKKRGKIAIRQVPVPPDLLMRLHSMTPQTSNRRLWGWGRTWAWMKIKETMRCADICGPHASPKGLRHGFGVHAVQSGVPLNMVQRWLGHADIKTTAIYTNAVGPEEQALAQRMWSTP